MSEEDITLNRQQDDALNFMERDGSLTDADMERMMSDGETRAVISELLDFKQAMRKQYRHHEPNVEDEWRKFAAGNCDIEADEPRRKKHSYTTLLFGTMIGVAATLLCIFIFTWVKDMEKDRLPVGYVVYEAKDMPQVITLQQGDEEAINITDNEEAEGTASHHRQALDYTAKPTGKNILQLLSIPSGKDFMVRLADSTKVIVNAGSKLEYPSVFDGNERNVALEGEAYFEVEKDGKRPFTVRTEHSLIKVYGTKFNVKDYSGKMTRVTLIEGSVSVTNLKSGQRMQLEPGDDVTALPDGTLMRAKVDTDSYVYWSEGYFYFDNQPLSEIMESLGRWYNVNIVFANKSMMNYRFHYLCDRSEDIDHAIRLLDGMNKVKIRRQGANVIVE
ncbi:MAG: DUF4974 domain-containing protein [Prevotellaceae bacterium]|nr:DUF4974 domain-containing protein [Prevotellaceae bacterium]